jgi:L-alanine-DL-glutamate epimerase-like enolase superfamily enzyme
MKITRLQTELFRVPLKRAIALPTSQEPRSVRHVELLLAHVHTDAGVTGLGLSYLLGGGGRALVEVVQDRLGPLLANEDPLRVEWLFARAATELGAIGFGGLGARAYAAIDTALWDLKGKVAGLPVYLLLGGYRQQVKAIVSDTATPALGIKQAVADTLAALDGGAAGVCIEIGTQDPEIDLDRVRQLRQSLPDHVWFEVSACGRYDAATALALGRLFVEELAIDGFSDPLHPDDWHGLTRLSQRLEVGLAVGGLADRVEDCLRLLSVGGIAAIRLDPVRLGGLTPVRKIGYVAEFQQVAIHPVRLPEVGVHLSCGLLLGRVGEYVDWFQELFEGGPRFVNGQLRPPEEAGLGLRLREREAERCRVWKSE